MICSPGCAAPARSSLQKRHPEGRFQSAKVGITCKKAILAAQYRDTVGAVSAFRILYRPKLDKSFSGAVVFKIRTDYGVTVRHVLTDLIEKADWASYGGVIAKNGLSSEGPGAERHRPRPLRGAQRRFYRRGLRRHVPG